MSTTTWLEKIVPAGIGATAGLLTFVFAGWIEGQKQFEIQKAEAYVNFSSASWESSPEESIDYTRAISRLSIYADDHVLNSLAAYHTSCASEDVSDPCKRAWADVVNQMRASVGQEPLEESTMMAITWGCLKGCSPE